MRAKRSFFNLITGLISQIVIMILGIIVTRTILVNFGSEVNGMVVSIGQFMIYLSLLEAGVGAASLQALYKPFSNNDKKNINSIMVATSNYYKKTGFFYFFAVIVLSLIFPIVVKSDLSYTTIMLVVLMTGIGGSINYFFQAKYRIFLSAEGKSYIDTLIVTLINIFISISKLVLVYLGFNIIAVQATHFIFILVQVIILQLYINKKYKWLDFKASPNLKAIEQKNSVLIHQISTLIFSNTDVIILTVFTDLKVVSVYVIYNMIFNIIDRLTQTINSSFTFILGQNFHENKEKFVKLFDFYEVYFMAFIFSICSVAYSLILPFIKLYTSGINDIVYLDNWIPILFVSIKLLTNVRSASNSIINIAGHFRKTQSRTIAESILNILFSLLFIQFFGIYGVLMGSIVAIIYRSTDIIFYTNRKILNRSPKKTFKRWLVNIFMFLIITYLTSLLRININSYIELILWSAILFLFAIFINFTICSIFEKEAFLYLRRLLSKIKLNSSKI